MSISTLFAWVTANYANLLALVVVTVAAASGVIKALEAVVATLETLFPSLAKADGALKKLSAFLDNLSKAGWLNTLAASPKRVDSQVAPK
jgi:hypothetical protein